MNSQFLREFFTKIWWIISNSWLIVIIKLEYNDFYALAIQPLDSNLSNQIKYDFILYPIPVHFRLIKLIKSTLGT